MTYRRALLTRWSRRDRLAVIVIAVAVAFLTGTTLVVLAVGSSTATIAAEFGAEAAVSHHASVSAAHAAAGGDALVVPLAEVTGPTGPATVVGVPANATVAGLALRGGQTTSGTLGESQTVELRGPTGTVERRVDPRSESPFPRDWYVTDPDTVASLGPTEALVVESAESVPSHGVPFMGVLAFFLAGTRSALATLSVAAGVGATLVGVTIYSITRMTVRDRVQELYVLRATGTTRWQVRRLFLSRGMLLLGVGTALGYALGVIVTNLAVNIAVAVGLPTSLSTRVTADAVRFLLPTYAGVVVVGGCATLVALQPELKRAPADITTSTGTYRLSGLRPRLLSERTAIPTAATLAAFVTFLFVVAGMATVAGPLASANGATITEPGTPHPIASQVPANYAEPLRDRGIAASPEILLFGVRDGQPFPARGANYTAFAQLSDAQLVAGREPTAPDEAVIGTDLAETLGVEVGDRILIGGSVDEAVARIHIVGAFAATGSDDDQLVVRLATARELTTVSDGHVNFIRAERLPKASADAGGATVTGLSAPPNVAVGESVTVRVTVRNDALQERTVQQTVRFGGMTQSVDVGVPASSQRTVQVRFTPDAPGDYRVRAGGVTANVTVLARNAIRLVGVPEEAPPGSRPRVRVVDARGQPVTDTTVTVGNWSGTTDGVGYVSIPLSEPGAYAVNATRGNRRDSATVTVTEDARRMVEPSVRVTPRQPSLLDRPTLVVTLANRWGGQLNRTVTVTAPGGPYQREISVSPGETQRVEWELPRQPPGQYDVAVTANDRQLASMTYRVTGDDRIVAALATSGRSGTSGIGQAVQVALGNLELALGALILLGGGMTIGGAAATFAGAVHANQETIGLHRAVGATRWQVTRLVLGDALRLGIVASLAAIAVGLVAVKLLDVVGLLTIYGIDIATTPSVPLLIAIIGGCLIVVELGAGIAVAVLLSRNPGVLLDGGENL